MNDTYRSPWAPFSTRGSNAPAAQPKVAGSAGDRSMQAEPSLMFDALYRTYFPYVYRRLYSLVGQHEEAEDLAQEVFAKAWRAWPPSSSEHLSGWLATIAIRTA